MKKKKILIIVLALFIIICLIGIVINKPKMKKENSNFKILNSFYPIYVLSLNLTDGAKNVENLNMAEKAVGCIHDYTLTTEDLKKFEDTDIFIENGGDLEPFSNKIKELYPEVTIVEASQNVKNIIADEEETNSHFWLSLDNYKTEIEVVYEALVKANPENKELYEANRNTYLSQITDLENDYESLDLKNMKVVCLNEALEYLLEDLEMDVTSVETDHAHSSLSAKAIKEIIDSGKQENVEAIFIDKDDSTEIAEMLSKETGAIIIKLDSGMQGEAKNKNAYIDAMKYNFNELQKLGD